MIIVIKVNVMITRLQCCRGAIRILKKSSANFFGFCYLRNVSSFCCVSPASDVTLGILGEVKLWKTHRPHALVVGEWRLELNKSQVIVVIGVSIIFWVFDNLFDWYILLVPFLSIQVMISCYDKNTSKCISGPRRFTAKKGGQ